MSRPVSEAKQKKPKHIIEKQIDGYTGEVTYCKCSCGIIYNFDVEVCAEELKKA